MKIKIANHAASALKKIPAPVRMEILASIKTLETNPFPPPPKGKRLAGMRPITFRLRVGDYRVIYREIESELVVLSVLHRKDLETEIKKLR